MRLYHCKCDALDAHYISLSVFCDVFGDEYTKPLYIEKNWRTANLSGKCHERQFLHREFYSLIKDTAGIYRYNASIYHDAHVLLGLALEQSPTLAFGLMKARPNDIQESYSPRDAYERAIVQSPVILATTDFVLAHLKIPETSLGLIGSAAIDPEGELRDLDLVFTGDFITIDRAYRWISEGHKTGSPLQSQPSTSLPIICAFFTSEPLLYPDLSNFRVIEPILKDFDVILSNPIAPVYLNIQIYSAILLPEGTSVLLVIRDTLSRAGLKIGEPLRLSGYLSVVNEQRAILITDVEQQIPTIPFHGGGTPCAYPSGIKKLS